MLRSLGGDVAAEVLANGQVRVNLGEPDFRPESLPFLADAVIDFSDELIGARFVIENPNATSSCGCGTSFSI